MSRWPEDAPPPCLCRCWRSPRREHKCGVCHDDRLREVLCWCFRRGVILPLRREVGCPCFRAGQRVGREAIGGGRRKVPDEVVA